MNVIQAESEQETDCDTSYLEKVHISNFYKDNNNGLEYGIHYYETNEDIFPTEAEWFGSEKERDKEVEKLLNQGHKIYKFTPYKDR